MNENQRALFIGCCNTLLFIVIVLFAAYLGAWIVANSDAPTTEDRRGQYCLIGAGNLVDWSQCITPATNR